LLDNVLARPTNVNDWLWVPAAVAYALCCGDGSVELMDDSSIEIEFTATATKPC
jgi:hypothetical protein